MSIRKFRPGCVPTITNCQLVWQANESACNFRIRHDARGRKILVRFQGQSRDDYIDLSDYICLWNQMGAGISSKNLLFQLLWKWLLEKREFSRLLHRNNVVKWCKNNWMILIISISQKYIDIFIIKLIK